MALDTWSAAKVPAALNYFSCHQTFVIPLPPPPFRFSVPGWGGDNSTLIPLSVQPVTSCHTLRSVNSVLSCWEGMHEANGAGIGKVNSPQGGSAATRAPVWRRRSSSC